MPERATSRTLREIVRVVASHFLSMIAVVAIIVVAAAVATWYAPRVYRSEATVMGSPGERFNPLADAAGSMRERLSLFVTTQRQILASDYVLAATLLRLEGASPPPEGADEDAAAQWDSRVHRYAAEHGEAIRQLRQWIEVVTPGGPDATFSQTFTIRVDWPEQRGEAREAGMGSRKFAALHAQKVAELLLESYMRRQTRLESRRTRAAVSFLRDKALAAARAALEAASEDLNRFITVELGGDLITVINMVGPGMATETGTARLRTNFQADLLEIRSRIAEVRALREAIDRELARDEPADIAIPEAVTAANPPMRELQTRIMALKLRINELEPQYTEDYQALRNLRAELQAAYRDLRTDIGRQSERLGAELATMQARKDTIEEGLAAERDRLETLAAKAARYKQLADIRDAVQQSYNAEQERIVNAITARELAAGSVLVTVIQQPTPPDPSAPLSPNVPLNLIIAAVSGIVLALVYAFLADHFDHSIKGIDDAERTLGAPVLGSVPKLRRSMVRLR